MTGRTTFLFAAALLVSVAHAAEDPKACAPADACGEVGDKADTATSPCSAGPALQPPAAPVPAPAPKPSGLEHSPCSALPVDASAGHA